MNTTTRRVSLFTALIVAASMSISASAWADQHRRDRGYEPPRHGAPAYDKHRHGKHAVPGRGPERGIYGSRGSSHGRGGHDPRHDDRRGHYDDRNHGHHHGHGHRYDEHRYYPRHHGHAPRYYSGPVCRDHRHRHWGHHYHDHYGEPHFFFGLRSGSGGFVIYN